MSTTRIKVEDTKIEALGQIIKFVTPAADIVNQCKSASDQCLCLQVAREFFIDTAKTYGISTAPPQVADLNKEIEKLCEKKKNGFNWSALWFSLLIMSMFLVGWLVYEVSRVKKQLTECSQNNLRLRSLSSSVLATGVGSPSFHWRKIYFKKKLKNKNHFLKFITSLIL